MPGIVGAVDFGGTVNTDMIVSKACEILNRKGTYKICKRSFGPRLSIARVHADIFNRDPQPFYDQASRISAFLEGEIYLPDTADMTLVNAQLRHIVEIYKVRGIGFASELNGSFLVVIYDEVKDLLLISTDRTASRPLLYVKTARGFQFSPEIKGILPNLDFDRTINEVALASFLTNGSCTGSHTLLQDVRILTPATTITIETKTASVDQHKYWDFQFDENTIDRGESYYIERLSSLLKKVGKRAVDETGDVAVLLSGGLDSRALLGCALDRASKTSAVTWGETSDKKDSDAVIARTISQSLNIEHRFFVLAPYELPRNAREWVYETEGMVDALGNYPGGLEIFEELRKSFQVIIRGDHIFGYRHSAANETEALALYAFCSDRLDPLLERLLKPNVYQRLSRLYREEIDKITNECRLIHYDNRKDYYYYLLRIFRYHNHLGYYKRKCIEQRNPLLDNEILDFVLQLPSKYRVNRELWGTTVTRTFPELAKFPIAKADNLPDWSKQFHQNREIQDFVLGTLIDDHSNDSGFFELFDPDKLKLFLESCLDNKSSRRALRGQLYASVTSSRLWSSKLGNSARESVVRYVRKGRRRSTPTHVMLMRLIILRLWYDQFLSNYEPAKVLDKNKQLIVNR